AILTISTCALRSFSLPPRPAASARSAPQHHRLEGLEEDEQIEADGVVFDVEEVIGEFVDVVGEGGAVAAVDLGPTGEPGLHRPAVAVEGNLGQQLLLLLGDKGAGADQGDIAAQNVEEL